MSTKSYDLYTLVKMYSEKGNNLDVEKAIGVPYLSTESKPEESITVVKGSLHGRLPGLPSPDGKLNNRNYKNMMNSVSGYWEKGFIRCLEQKISDRPILLDTANAYFDIHWWDYLSENYRADLTYELCDSLFPERAHAYKEIAERNEHKETSTNNYVFATIETEHDVYAALLDAAKPDGKAFVPLEISRRSCSLIHAALSSITKALQVLPSDYEELVYFWGERSYIEVQKVGKEYHAQSAGIVYKSAGEVNRSKLVLPKALLSAFRDNEELHARYIQVVKRFELDTRCGNRLASILWPDEDV